MTEMYNVGTVQVYVQGRGWTFDPLCLEPAPGETATYTPDPKSMSSSHFFLVFSLIHYSVMSAICNCMHVIISGQFDHVFGRDVKPKIVYSRRLAWSLGRPRALHRVLMATVNKWFTENDRALNMSTLLKYDMDPSNRTGV